MIKHEPLFSLLANFWIHIEKKRKLQLLALILLTIFVSLTEIISIGAVLPFLGALTAPETIFEIKFLQPLLVKLNILNPSELLFPMTLLFIITVIISGIMRLILIWTQTNFGYAIGSDISIDVYKKILYSPYSLHVSRNSSEFLSGITNKTTMLVTQVILPTLLLISASIILIAIFITLLLIDSFVAISATLGFAGTYGLILILTKKKLLRNSESISKKTNLLIQSLQEGFGGIRDVILDGAQEVYCKIFRGVELPLRKDLASVVIIGQTPRFIVEAFGVTILSILAYDLSQSSSGINKAIPIIGVFALAAQRLLPIWQQIYSSWTSILGCSALLRDILFYLNQALPKNSNNATISLIKFDKHINLENLNFRYIKEGPLIINDLSYKIHKGEKIGLIGTTGSGKSTFVDILMGLLIPQGGQISIDDQVVTSRNYRNWQGHISHVPQNIFLADSTILENIAFGVPLDEIDHKLVYDCAKKAQISRAIESWPLKYNTLVGERGVRLSGGQRQRIGIARALYKQTDVIIFDEATSALDNKTEHKVMDSIFKLTPNITIFIIAHRLTTLEKCSQVIELEEGKIIRSGAYKTIVGK
ncbi:MAG: ABC transporter ATP-binding protein [Nitrosomonadales bacterium]|jgi:ATP-binding cassette subfamily B protein|nr:ABC transporter ATP-binding protein [Nitrosomonadales bacterium]